MELEMKKIALIIAMVLIATACKDKPAESVAAQDTSEPESTPVEEVTVQTEAPA